MTPEEQIQALTQRVAQLESKWSKLVNAIGGGGASSSSASEVASDRELDSAKGNPPIKFDPRDWNGESCIGRRMSECPLDYLEFMIESGTDYVNYIEGLGPSATDKQKKNAKYKRFDLRLARGWLERMSDPLYEPPAATAEPDNPWTSKSKQSASSNRQQPPSVPQDTGSFDNGDDEIPF